MKTFLDVLGFLFAISAYDWMRANAPAKRCAAWIAAIVVALCVWPMVQVIGDLLLERFMR